MKTVLVTGGAGFIGSHICDLLIRKKYKVIIADNLSTGKKENIHPKAKFYKVDITSSRLEDIFKVQQIDFICHQAAQINIRTSISDPLADAMINVMGSIKLMQLAKKYSVEKFIFASSGGAIYGDAHIFPTKEDSGDRPISPYGAAKLAVEHYLRLHFELYGLKYFNLRYSNVYGERQDSQGEGGVIAIFADRMMNNKEPKIYGDGNQTRDFIYAGDVARANLIAFETSTNGTCNISTSKEITINELYQIIKNLIGYKGNKIHTQAVKGDIYKSCLDNNLAKQMLNFKPEMNLTEGLKRVIKGIRF